MGTRPFTHARLPARPPLDRVIAHYWHVAWDLPDGVSHSQATLPHPSLHLVFEDRTARVYGVRTGRFTRVLRGRDHVFGVKFHPGVAAAVLGRDAARMTDRIVPAEDILGATIAGMAFPDDATPDAMAQIVEAELGARLPAPDAEGLRAQALVALIADDHALTSVAHLAARGGIGARHLQRLFRTHVGVGPKWVIRRYRLHEALARIDAGMPANWAAFAQDLGYADQAHFVRDFHALVGMSPGRYGNARSNGPNGTRAAAIRRA